jgi:hypothetical protein
MLMAKKGFRWEFVALSAVLTLVILSLSYTLYEKVGVKDPLERLLMSDNAVKNVTATKDKGVTVLEIEFNRVEDFAASYGAVEKVIRERLGENYRILVKDARNDKLDDSYLSIHYYLEEASVRGNFGDMIESCQDKLLEKDISNFKIVLDERHIYVQIADEGAYLYAVLDRTGLSTKGGAP